MQQGSRYLRKMPAQLRNREVMHKLNKINIDEGRSPNALFLMDILTTFGKLPTPATHHLLTRDVRPIDLAMNFNWRNAFCIEELYHRPNLAGGGRRNKSFHFGPLLTRYCHEVGPVRLAYH
ncbi:uncharacterized protein TNCV_5049891 [Trichonephila clavipes]|nr:uncharacterized protein TNCV_5049891 [Trichonephila clavipes]